MTAADPTYVRNPAIAVTEIDDETFLVEPAEGEVFYLDEISSALLHELGMPLPDVLADLIRNDSSNFITKNVIAPAPDDIADGYVAWELKSNRELLGGVQINLSWNAELKGLDQHGEDVGNSVDSVTVGRLMPQGVDRSWGQIVLKKAENLDVTPTGLLDEAGQGNLPVNLRPIDPQHDILLTGDTAGGALAMEFHGNDWELGLKVQRFELKEVEKTAVELGYVRVQIGKGGNAVVRAVFRMRSVDQRIGLTMPPHAELTNDPLRINGASVGLEINDRGVVSNGEQSNYFIPLTTQSLGEVFVIELVYNISQDSNLISIPQFPEVEAVNQIFVGVELPKDYVLLDYSGDWDDHLEGSWLEHLQTQLVDHDRYFDAQQVINEVVAGYPVSDIYPSHHQQTIYFSTINPGDSVLNLTLKEKSQVNLMIFIGLAVVGFVGIFLNLRKQVALLLIVIAASLGIAMIKPVLSSSVEISGILVGMSMMVVVWAVRDIGRPFVGLSKLIVNRTKASVSKEEAEVDVTPEPEYSEAELDGESDLEESELAEQADSGELDGFLSLEDDQGQDSSEADGIDLESLNLEELPEDPDVGQTEEDSSDESDSDESDANSGDEE